MAESLLKLQQIINLLQPPTIENEVVYDMIRKMVSSPQSSSDDSSTDIDAVGGEILGDPEECDLIGHISLDDRETNDHELRTAPVVTREAYLAAGAELGFPQRGVLGTVLAIDGRKNNDALRDPRLYINTNAPFSALVCGVQGSGKSHTVSVMLEDMLIPECPRIGSLQKPLSALVLHFGEGGPMSQPSEAAWVGKSDIPGVKTPNVRVFVSPSSINTMQAVYAPILSSGKVEPLRFNESEIDAQAFLSMMAIGSSESAPLYMQIVLSILRELGENYTYKAFKTALDVKKKTFNPQQVSGLEQRMALLESFLDTKGMKKSRPPPVRFAAGQMTIVDLSDPFLDPASACGLFEIITRLFVRANVGTGKVLVVDEAHKYLAANNGKGPSGLTKELTSLIRQQRHLAMRVLISTQEPTVVPPVLLDLCSVTILHRFSSPSWWEHVAKHVSADIDKVEAFDRVVRLQTGQAIILAPSGLSLFRDPLQKSRRVLSQFGRRSVLIKTRKRITRDGGASLLVIES